MDTLSHVVVAQLQPRGKVRAVVIGIGPKPWLFTPSRAVIKCQRAFPEKSADEIATLVNQLQVLADAAIAPIRDALGAVPVQPRKPSAAAAKRKARRNATPLPGGLVSGFLGRLR